MEPPLRRRSLFLAIALALATSARAAVPLSGDVLAVESSQRRVIVVSALDGARSVLTTSPLPAGPGDAALARGGPLYVAITGALVGVVRVDLASGNWSWVTTGGLLTLPLALALDRDGALLVVEGSGAGSIVRVDPVSGTQSTAVPASAALGARGIVVLANGDFLVSTGSRIARWNRGGGTATTFASGADLIFPTQLTLMPAAGKLAVCAHETILDAGVLLVMDATTGARSPAIRGLNILRDVTVALDGNLVFCDGGTTVGRSPIGGPWTVLTTWGGASDPLDPTGTNSYRGVAVMDGPTAARTTSWGQLKRLYRP